MSTADAARERTLLTSFEQLRLGKQIVQRESDTLSEVARRLDSSFCRAVELVFACRGSVIVSGMGKAGLIGQKIMATLASTGTPSHCLHPAEAVHGDLGRVGAEDVVLLLSQSGETEEVVRLLPPLAELAVPIIAITARADSTLGRAATVVIALGPIEEACTLGLAPSSSTTAMLAVGDAVALVASRMKSFSREDFARFHPAGSLGRKLSKVDDVLRPLGQCRVARDRLTVREVFVSLSTPGRRTGAIMLVDEQGLLSGLFTDSDLARLFELRRDSQLDGPVADVMTAHPLTVRIGSRLVDAVELMAKRKISELPVVDEESRPVGLIDITDVVGILPKESVAKDHEPSPLQEGGALARAERAADDGKPKCRVFREPEDSADA
jgi:arabinose-5-phosphate isomerase